MKRSIILLFLLALHAYSFGLPPGKSIKPQLYSSGNSSPFVLNAGYRCPLGNSPILNSGHGFFFEAGFNPAFYFSKRQLFGFFGGWGWKDRAWATAFNQGFAEGFNDARTELTISPGDSTFINTFRELINTNKKSEFSFPGCKTTAFHNSSVYYGIIMRLPFKRYNPCLKIYRGETRSSCTTEGLTQNAEYGYFQLRRKMLGAELVIFPGWQRESGGKIAGTALLAHIAALSVYYEQADFYHSTLYFTDGNERVNIPLTRFVSSSFLQRYRQETSFGIRLSAGIY
ncbi:MAG: hypothetical protein JWO09_3216 [Bacteroidetes bacterium]|nr:hypothetical protein [Bacteroidota bacterium]